VISKQQAETLYLLFSPKHQGKALETISGHIGSLEFLKTLKIVNLVKLSI
jgi:hypothetical protein